MPPRKPGVSRKVRIAGPYQQREAEALCGNTPPTEDPPVPSTSNPPPPTHVLSLAQVAAAREATGSIVYSHAVIVDMHDTPLQYNIMVLNEASGVDGDTGGLFAQ
jgi:hypothetical protein